MDPNSTGLFLYFFPAFLLNVIVCAWLGYCTHRLPLRRRLNVLLLCVLAIAYQVATWGYHSAADVVVALYWLKFQIAISLIAIPTLYTVLIAWVDNRFYQRLVMPIYFVALVLFAVNLLSPATLVFSEVQQLQHYQVFEQGALNALVGTSSVWRLALLVFVLGLFVLQMGVVSDVARSGRKALAYALLAVVLIQCMVTISNRLSGLDILPDIWAAGMPYIILSLLLCINIALSFALQVELLDKTSSHKVQLEAAITQLARGVRQTGTEQYFHEMLKSLYALFGAKYILIGVKDELASVPTIQSKAMLVEGNPGGSMRYSLKNTPCDSVMRNDICVYQNNVDVLFPEDKMLSEFGLKSYIGVPFVDDDGISGLLALLDDKPIKPDHRMIETIEVFAARAGVEIRREQMESRLRQMAYVDYSTGLPSQMRLFEEIKRTYAENKANSTQSMMLLFDLDRFTEVNRHFGYDIGDEVLHELGARITLYGNEQIFVARNAGDEFAVIIRGLVSASDDILLQHWHEIRNIIQRPVEVNGVEVVMDCCMGAVCYPVQTANRYDVIRAAESALQSAKQEGPGHYSLFDPQQLANLDRQRAIEHGLIQALDSRSQLNMVYQPKVDVNGRCVGAEALIRWAHPEEGFISPAEFIPVAENSALIIRLGEWVIQQVCKQTRAWIEEGVNSDIRIAINISAIHFSHHSFLPYMFKTVKRYGISAKNIELELTETGLLNNIALTVDKLKVLMARGYSIALDDFGTGYSSLSYLQELPLNVLKIDKSFIDKIDDDSSQELIKSIILIGKHLGLAIIAEGTENAEQVDKLTVMGCEVFQGYYFSRPVTAADFLTWISGNKASRPSVSLDTSRGIEGVLQ